MLTDLKSYIKLTDKTANSGQVEKYQKYLHQIIQVVVPDQVLDEVIQEHHKLEDT